MKTKHIVYIILIAIVIVVYSHIASPFGYITDLAVEYENEDICNFIVINQEVSKSICIQEVAIASKQLFICDKIKYDKKRSLCYVNFHKRVEDDEYIIYDAPFDATYLNMLKYLQYTTLDEYEKKQVEEAVYRSTVMYFTDSFLRYEDYDSETVADMHRSRCLELEHPLLVERCATAMDEAEFFIEKYPESAEIFKQMMMRPKVTACDDISPSAPFNLYGDYHCLDVLAMIGHRYDFCDDDYQCELNVAIFNYDKEYLQNNLGFSNCEQLFSEVGETYLN